MRSPTIKYQDLFRPQVISPSVDALVDEKIGWANRAIPIAKAAETVLSSFFERTLGALIRREVDPLLPLVHVKAAKKLGVRIEGTKLGKRDGTISGIHHAGIKLTHNIDAAI